VVRRERDATILAALAELRPEDQELLRLAWWEELPHAEIAPMVGCSTDAVTHRIYRAAQRVAKEYQRLDRSHETVEMPRQLRGGEQ
jgi:RNA polymerase sigma-70 factor (ECF subfamily)